LDGPFPGTAADGDWTLSITDGAGGDEGYLWTWTLFIELGQE